MATVTTNLSTQQYYFPYAGYEEPSVADSAIPRGEIRVIGLGKAIAAAGVGDNQLVAAAISLPANFAYVFMDLSLSLSAGSGNTNNFAANGQAAYFDASTSSLRQVSAEMGLESINGYTSSPVVDTRQYRVFNPYKGVVIPKDNVQLVCRVYNDTANDAAYQANFNARFLQFDIQQANFYGVNTAIPTR